MKNALILFIMVFTVHGFSLGQGLTPEKILQKKHLETAQYQPPQNTGLSIPTPFAQAQLNFPEAWNQIEKESIRKITLVYTAYRSSETFNQKRLNKQRILALQKSFGTLMDQSFIQWEIVRQTGAQNPEEGKALFHGFRVEYQPTPTPDMVQKEIAYLAKVFKALDPEGAASLSTENQDINGSNAVSFSFDKEIPSSPSNGGNFSSSSSSSSSTSTSSTSSTPSASTANTSSSSTISQPPSDPYFDIPPEPTELTEFTIKTRWDDRIGYVHDTIWTKGNKASKVNAIPPGLLLDSNVLAVLDRHPDWDTRLMVIDVTQSMSPFTAQVMAWMKQKAFQESNEKRFIVLFNDGDGKAPNNKTIGKTGGVYTLENPELGELFQTMAKATSKARRNDTPENDVEGLLAAIEACPECSEVILIADNHSSMRDKSLMNQITIPVHSILCGASKGINPQYLDMARKTHGSVHTVLEDVTNFSGLLDGDKVKVHNIYYELNEGHFTPVYSW